MVHAVAPCSFFSALLPKAYGVEQSGKKAFETNLAVCPLLTLLPGWKHGVPVVQGGLFWYPLTMPCMYTLSMDSQNV